MKPVAILGAAQTRHAGRRDDANYMELAFEVVSELLEKTGYTHNRIDTVITASSDFADGRTISDIAVQDATGSAFKSASKVSMDGAFALVYAAARINSGKYKTCLVVAHGKMSEGDPRLISNAAFDPLYQRSTGITDHAALGLQARRYMDRTGVSAEVIAETASRSAAAAARNPFAHRREAGKEMVADPLHENEIAPDSDGACALLLATEGGNVWLDSFGICTDAHGLGDRDLGEPGVLPRAARMAGVQPAELDLVEVHDASSVQTLLWKEGLGLADGVSVNPSGGAMGSQPGFATGLVRVAEVFERVQKAGVAHGMTGYTGQAHCVWVLRKR